MHMCFSGAIAVFDCFECGMCHRMNDTNPYPIVFLQEFDHGRDHLTFAALWADIRDLGRTRALQLPGSVLLHR